MTRIHLIGPGAIGGTVAAGIAESGRHDFTICGNQAFDALTVTRSDTKEFRSLPVRVVTKPSEVSRADWVLLAVKSHQTPSTAEWLKAAVGPSTKLAILQNGVEHKERVRGLVPASAPLLPIVVQLPAERTAPGKITTYGPALLIAADNDIGREFAGLFENTSVRVQLSDDFMTRQWEKLCLNAASGSLTTLTMDPDAIARVPGLRDLAKRIADECVAVGRAEGAKFADDFAANLANMLAARRGNRGNSMYYDRRDGKELEYDARNAVIARLGAKHGIATPLSSALVPLLRALGPQG
ncbi:MAG: 2-dehydropantoate 2-reductase [Proteobacteria bacterium]|nr:2-dehydropantoate 2-reductase [Pseudomonadota bacterium]